MGVKIAEKTDGTQVLYYVKAMISFFCKYGNYEVRSKARTRYIQEELGDEFTEKFNIELQKALDEGGLDCNITENKVTKDGEPPIKKVVIIAKESKFEALKQAMNNIGVTGMTVVHVLGCGVQKGSAEYYRGVEVEMSLLPKIKVEIVVSKVPVDTVVETAKKVLYTGHIGDGKIFVYNIENVIKVRTGEEGFAALQDVE